MKTKLLIIALGWSVCLNGARAQLTIPSDGSDGALAPTTNIVIDLSQAVPGRWDANNSANAGKGVYDKDKWAVVFKYSSVNIPGVLDTNGNVIGVTVTFKNHPSRAPVVWLVQEGVTVSGIVDLSGQNFLAGAAGLTPAEPGPGGFRGGPFGPQGHGDGLGPGGGQGAVGGIGTFAESYGNPQLIPLIAGSGGAGSNDREGRSGAAGGGALLIAASRTFLLNGRISSKGGDAYGFAYFWWAGSGGGVRIVANQISGVGEINCLGGQCQYGPGGRGGSGRIRLESLSLAPTIKTFPETIAVPPATPPIIWPPDNAPKVRIVSVDTVNAPADPTAPLTSSADIAIQNDKPVNIVLETQNFPIEGDVSVRAAQKWGPAVWLKAQYVSGNATLATWQLTTNLVKGYTTLQARATAP